MGLTSAPLPSLDLQPLPMAYNSLMKQESYKKGFKGNKQI